jgi:hypothetical protein
VRRQEDERVAGVERAQALERRPVDVEPVGAAPEELRAPRPDVASEAVLHARELGQVLARLVDDRLRVAAEAFRERLRAGAEAAAREQVLDDVVRALGARAEQAALRAVDGQPRLARDEAREALAVARLAAVALPAGAQVVDGGGHDRAVALEPAVGGDARHARASIHSTRSSSTCSRSGSLKISW